MNDHVILGVYASAMTNRVGVGLEQGVSDRDVVGVGLLVAFGTYRSDLAFRFYRKYPPRGTPLISLETPQQR